MEKEYMIGIDPGVNTGIAIYCNVEKNLVYLKSLMIHRAMKCILECKDHIKLVKVEDARLRQRITGGREKLQGAGSIKRDSKIWDDFLKDNNIPYKMIAPKFNKTKLNQAIFNKLTGISKTSNQHARDAAGLVFPFGKRNVTK